MVFPSLSNSPRCDGSSLQPRCSSVTCISVDFPHGELRLHLWDAGDTKWKRRNRPCALDRMIEEMKAEQLSRQTEFTQKISNYGERID